MYKTILVDDERRPRDVLAFKIRELCPELEIVACASNAAEAYDLCQTFTPDLVFLDISMPDESGFDFLNKFDEIPFEVIFSTAYQEFMLDAFKVSAVGYLLKPIENEDLISAVGVAIKHMNHKESAKKYRTLLENMQSQHKDQQNLVIPCNDRYEYVQISQILYCEGSDKYTYIHVKDGRKILSSHYVGKFKSMLSEYNFFVCHKSYIVNLNCVQSLSIEDEIVINDDHKIPLARRRKAEFLHIMKTMKR